MQRFTIKVGTFEVNCSILSRNGRALFVDPGDNASRIINLMDRQELTPEAILLTHTHFDHIGAIPELQQAYPDLPVYVHPKDIPLFGHPMNQYPPDYPQIDLPKNIRDLADLRGVSVIETPGHTPGGVCYYLPDDGILLSGDTLFAGSVGRTDLPGGDMATLSASLKKLADLPDYTLVIPGHGPHTTIHVEKEVNPFLR